MKIGNNVNNLRKHATKPKRHCIEAITDTTQRIEDMVEMVANMMEQQTEEEQLHGLEIRAYESFPETKKRF